jgi:hypothetical protein
MPTCQRLPSSPRACFVTHLTRRIATPGRRSPQVDDPCSRRAPAYVTGVPGQQIGGWQPVGCSGTVSDETSHVAGPGETRAVVSAALLPTFRYLPISRQPFVGTRLTQPSQIRAYTPGFWRMTGVFPDWRGSGTALAQIPSQQQRAQRRIQSAAGSLAGQLLPRVARSWAMPRVTGESGAYVSPHPASLVASRPREMPGGACDR